MQMLAVAHFGDFFGRQIKCVSLRNIVGAHADERMLLDHAPADLPHLKAEGERWISGGVADGFQSLANESGGGKISRDDKNRQRPESARTPARHQIDAGDEAAQPNTPGEIQNDRYCDHRTRQPPDFSGALSQQQEGKQCYEDQHLLTAKIHPVPHESTGPVVGHIRVNMSGMESLLQAIVQQELDGRDNPSQGGFEKQSLIKYFQMTGAGYQIECQQNNQK